MISDEELKRLEELEKKANCAGWRISGGQIVTGGVLKNGKDSASRIIGELLYPHDKELVVELRNAFPKILQDLKSLREENGRYKEALERISKDSGEREELGWNEWSEAKAFEDCRKIAQEALKEKK